MIPARRPVALRPEREEQVSMGDRAQLRRMDPRRTDARRRAEFMAADAFALRQPTADQQGQGEA